MADDQWTPDMPERRSGVGTDTIPNLVQTYAGLTTAVEALTHSNDRRERRNILVYTLMTLLLVVAISVPLYIRHLGSGSREGIHRIVDCTTAGGQCYEQAIARQADSIRRIAEENAKANVELAVCMKTAKTTAELRGCANKNIAALQPR